MVLACGVIEEVRAAEQLDLVQVDIVAGGDGDVADAVFEGGVLTRVPGFDEHQLGRLDRLFG